MMPDALLARAMAYELSGQDGLALRDLETASRNSQMPELMNYYGYFLVNHGIDVERGIRFIRIALVDEPDNPYYLDSYGWAHYKKGEYSEAVRLLEYAYALAPRNPVILSHLGDAYWAAGRHREAKFAWGKALRNLDNNKFIENITEAQLRQKLAR
jgi:tetratricopeptide (TPR) repeat protein